MKMKTLVEILNGHKIIAHRGCWDNTFPENSLPALEKAVLSGYAIELDVHLTADNEVVVFHDFKLGRMCGAKGKIEENKLSDLLQLRLKNTQYTIPTFYELLEVVDGKVPLFIELKCLNNEFALVDAIETALIGYKGECIIIGFSEKAIKYAMAKGFMVCLSRFVPRLARFIPDGMLCEVHFIPLTAKHREKYPTLVPWTASSKAMRRFAEKRCIATIYNTKFFDDLH